MHTNWVIRVYGLTDLYFFAIAGHERPSSDSHISVTNCTFFGGEGSALFYSGKNTKIYNKEFAWNDWTGQMGLTVNGGQGTIFSQGTDEEFVGNTLLYNGVTFLHFS